MRTEPAMMSRAAFSRVGASPRSTRATSRRGRVWRPGEGTTFLVLAGRVARTASPLVLGAFLTRAPFASRAFRETMPAGARAVPRRPERSGPARPPGLWANEASITDDALSGLH